MVSIRNDKTGEGEIDRSQSSIDSYWKISDKLNTSLNFILYGSSLLGVRMLTIEILIKNTINDHPSGALMKVINLKNSHFTFD